MDLTSAKQLAINKMEEHGLLNKGWFFSFDNAKRRFGACNYRLQKYLCQRIWFFLTTKNRCWTQSCMKSPMLWLVGVMAMTMFGEKRLWKSVATENGVIPMITLKHRKESMLPFAMVVENPFINL